MQNALHCACPCAPDSPRRGFQTGLLGLSAASVLPTCALPAPSGATGAPGPSTATLPPRIDTHHHFFSPTYVAELDKVGQAAPIVKNWTLNKTLDDMARAGVVAKTL